MNIDTLNAYCGIELVSIPYLISGRKLSCLALTGQEDRSLRHAQSATDSDPGFLPRVESYEIRTTYLGAVLCKSRAEAQCRQHLVWWCLTDPEPDMETRQAQFRNMHSKCRC